MLSFCAMRICLLIFIFGCVHLATSQLLNDTTDMTDASRLFPVVFNLAKDARISVNATCGQTKNETYCRLVEHVPNHMDELYAQCRVCYGQSPDESERHPIENAIDGTGSWWQSPSLDNGLQYHHVTITLDLKQVFQVAYVIIKAANSPRPGNWILERSTDGINYKPWQYFAQHDNDCERLYNTSAVGLMHRFTSDSEVLCTSYYSDLEPLGDGEIHTSIVNGRPSIKMPSPELMDFLSARYVRLRFQRIRTLNADLMVDRESGYMDPLVYRRYFYSIKDISIGGQCICYGHASACIPDFDVPADEPALKCQCEHNTCGESCNECCPFYHQKPWQPGSTTMGYRCQPCNCFGHAKECYYDPDVDARHESLNIDGQYDGGGVCVGCQDNTMGINCETCLDGYYRPLGIEANDPTPCLECQCNPVGTRSDPDRPVSMCVKDDSRMYEGLNPGDCFCKEGYAGPNCDQCARGYKGYPDCIQCKCNLAGSSNDDVCEGPCVCKANVEGENCDQCKADHFNLSEDNVDGCTTCFCFGITTECQSIPWGIDKITQMNGWFITDMRASAYLYPAVAGPNVISINHQKAMDILDTVKYYWFAPQEFLGNKLTAYGGNLQFTVSYSNRKQTPSPQPTKGFDIILEGNTISLYQSFMVVLPNVEETVLIKMLERDWYILSRDVDLDAGVTGRPATQAEFMSALAGVQKLLIRATYSSSPEESRLKDVILDVVSEESIDGVDALTSVEQCECPPTYEGLSCEDCEYGFRRVGGRLEDGRCERCDCNNHAMECSDFTGECYDCDHNTTGARCEFCVDGHYGFPAIGTPIDCQKCACPLLDADNNFSPTCVAVADLEFGYVCDQCPIGYTGPKCDRCADGYYGNPMEPGNYCRPCSDVCNGNVDPAAVGNCNTLTGECLRCIGNTMGPTCGKCKEGYYGDAVNGQCTACRCDPEGSRNMQCNMTSGQCDCKPSIQGIRCDTCDAGFWNLTAKGCESCECDPLGSVDGTCDPLNGQCSCKKGVTGAKCDRCDFGHYNLGNDGCKECDCAITNGYCNPDTGECACPPNTARPNCDRCTEYAWGYDKMQGCKMCTCSAVGSSGMACDQETGQCVCIKDYTGRMCDQCPFGHRQFPKCKKCKCNAAGRDPDSCQGDRCACEDTGHCTCKENVRGKKCTKCKSGTFSLQSKSPVGCTECFCFGTTDSCGEAGYMVDQISVKEVPNVFVDSLGQPINESNEVMLETNQSFFWSLPDDFLGNKITSYGGLLKYLVGIKYKDDPSTMTESVDDLMIRGTSHTVVMNVADPVPRKSRYKLDLIEHNFVLQDSKPARAPTRPEFMMVLQDIQAILIKASYVENQKKLRLVDVMMETALPANETTSTKKAQGIEMCQCPTGYTGLSCEQCASGYFRVADGAYLGTCEPCTCNGHSSICDDSTGVCEGCEHNTTGDRCDVCASGYYGDATQGTPDDCQQCACPMVDAGNNFSPTCELAEDGTHNCTACEVGYTGRFCERCADGYYGNPTIPGGSCQPCLCNALGAVNQVCNQTDGACNCLPGVAGHHCDECEERYVVSVDGCMSCDDNCTGLLLDMLDDMEDKLLMANLSGLVPAPWQDLIALENATKLVQMDLMVYTDQLDYLSVQMMPLLEESSLAQDVHNLHVKANNTLKNAMAKARDSNDTVMRAINLEGNVTSLYMDLRETLMNLEDSFPVSNLTVDESAILLAKARKIIMEIQDRDFTVENLLADEELRLANETLQSLPGDYTRIMEALHKNADRLTGRASNLTDLLNELLDSSLMANNMTDVTVEVNERGNKAVANIKNKTSITKTLQNEIKAELQFSTSLLDQSSELIGQALSVLGNISSELDGLRDVYPDLQLNVDLMEQNLNGLREKVEAAVAHSMNLTQLAEYLDELFGPTRDYAEDALKAAKAYSDIVEAIDAAMMAAQDAENAANKASDYVYANGTSLFTRAYMLRQKGVILRSNASKLVDKVVELEDRLKMVQGDLGRITEKSDEAENNLEISIKACKTCLMVRYRPFKIKYLFNISMKADIVINTSDNAKDKAEKVLQDTKDVRAALPDLANKMNDITEDTEAYNTALDQAEQAVQNTTAKVQEISQLQSTLTNKALELERLEGTMANNLADLRDKIRNARNQASKIRVALKSDGTCARSYKPEVSPSAYNSIKMSVSISKADNSLFYIKSNTTDDFLHLETLNGELMFFWDVGSGVGMVSVPETLATNKSYMIDVERFGNSASVTVRGSPSEEGITATGKSHPGASILDVDENSTMFIGGIPSSYNDVVGVKSFHGCMAEVTFDDKFIGFWNFLTVEGNCTGCNVRIEVDEKAKEYVSFDGTGYSNLERPSDYNDKFFSISFSLRTYATDALLYFMASEDQVDFQSIEIVRGHLVIKHNCGSGVGSFTSPEKVNTGEWIPIVVIRQQQIATLTLNNVKVGSAVSPGSLGGMQVNEGRNLYVGGVTRGFQIKPELGISTKGYIGCLSLIKFFRSTLKLIEPGYSIGVSEGCPTQAIRNVGFYGDSEGYVALHNFALPPKTELSFTFASKQEDAVMLSAGQMVNAGRRKKDVDPDLTDVSYSISLNRGRVQAQINAGQGELTLVTRKGDGLFNDGHSHVVQLTKDDLFIRITVDDTIQRGGKLPQGSKTHVAVNSPLYIGNVGPDIIISDKIAQLPAFSGCIENLIIGVEGVVVDFAESENFEKADLGRCGPLVVPPPTTELPTTTDLGPLVISTPESDDLGPLAPANIFTATTNQSLLERCYRPREPEVITGGIRFGATSDSHAEVAVEPDMVSKLFQVEIELRTRSQDGLVFFISDGKDGDFCLLQIMKGFVLFVFDNGGGQQTILTEFVVDDGNWHTIEATRNRKTGMLIVDSQPKQRRKAEGGANSMKVQSPLYVGGLPDQIQTTVINEDDRFADSPSQEVRSFNGCIRKFVVNGNRIELENAEVTEDISPCYTNTEIGAYFQGSGYAVLEIGAYFQGSGYAVLGK
ncbi:laminin subunit alpha-2-like [Amphiura filiformis]|uniref:laminin subunit alpha-2-like n=1 Tax=Amphiura filiformis TaxID=82378 RepID=UPI003B21272A